MKAPFSKRIKKLRDDIVHLGVGRDIAIFQSLSLSTLIEAEKKIVGWLDTVEELMGERHPDTRKLGRKIQELSPEVQEEYSGDDAK